MTGDSAGGRLALLVAGSVQPASVAVAALSPATDLARSGDSWNTHAEADPYITAAQAAGLVQEYLAGHDLRDPAASPLYGNLAGLPPTRIDVGDDEVLLDDSLRYGAQAISARGCYVLS